MITRKLEKVYYQIIGKDESGLIPEGAKGCIVGYEVSHKGRFSIYVKFDPAVELSEETWEQDNKRYKEEGERLNPVRTEQEIRKIAAFLESRLEGFD
jgi:hypothetical protein